jgi:hypothetical protein
VSEPAAAVEVGPRHARRRAFETRALAALTLAICLAVLITAATLPPDPRGYGTHERLFGGPCGFLVVTGLPCPTCGMTTAFAHAVRGQFGSAFRAQPAGLVLALLAIAGVPLALAALIRGRWLDFPLWRVPAWLIFTVCAAVFIAGWIWKIVAGLASGSLPYR